jgi:Aspartyl protease
MSPKDEIHFSGSSRGPERCSVSDNCFVPIRKRSGHRRGAVACVLLAGFLSAIGFAGDITVPAPPKKAQAAETPFSLRQGYMIVVEGRVADLDRLNLVIDTGTNPSMIDKSISDKLSLKGSQRGLSLFNKDLASETVMLPDLELGPLHRVNLAVMVADFSKIGKELGIRVDGVIGLDVLGASSFTLDYQKNRILFHASHERHSTSFAAGPQFITVNLKTGGKDLRMLLDTGTPQLILFNDSLRNLDYDWLAATGTGQNISGTVAYGTIILPSAKLGSEDFGPQRASVVASQKSAETSYDGLIGVAFLRPKQLSFDFDRQILGWSN